MDMFNKEALNRVTRELASARAEITKLARRLDEATSHEASEAEARRTAESERDELKGQLADVEASRDKALERMTKAEQMAHWLEEKAALVKASTDEAQHCRAEAEAAKTDAETVRREMEEVRAEVDRLRAQVAEMPRPTLRTATEVSAAPTTGPDPAVLRRSLAELQYQLQVALRKAENNRRAYLITQMQLDLAEDRLSIQMTGKPRPIMGEGRRSEVSADETATPEDVLEYPDADDEPESESIPEAVPDAMGAPGTRIDETV